MELTGLKAGFSMNNTKRLAAKQQTFLYYFKIICAKTN
jgi:hypothetical protein